MIDPNFARAAWTHVSRFENPMPPPAALDWLRERAGTDDTEAVLAAIRAAAVEGLFFWMRVAFGRHPGDSVKRFLEDVTDGQITRARRRVPQPIPRDGVYGAFWGRADRELGLIEQLTAIVGTIQ